MNASSVESKPIVVLCQEGRSTRVIANALAARFPDVRLVEEQAESRLLFIRRRARRLGWRKVAGQLAFQTAVSPLLARAGRARVAAILERNGLSDAQPRLPVERVESVNEPSAAQKVAALEPAVVVVSGTRIISAATLDAIGAPTVNMHMGITPAYRGVHGGWWALASGDPAHCGVTVHLVDSGVDTGAVVGQAVVAPERQDTFATLPTLQLAAGVPLLLDAVERVCTGKAPTPVDVGGRSEQWYHPTLLDWVRARASGRAR